MSLPTFSSLSLRPPRPAIVYPDSDGQPMAENTLQWAWMVMIKCGLDVLFKDDPNVFVASDHLWYPVEGQPTIRMAPDVYVVFGRPKVHRGSYRQWEECGIAPQVVFEILSPGNRAGEMQRKFDFYQRYGVEEYYVYDPQDGTLEGWLRLGDQLQPVADMQGWVSPRLRIRLELDDGELRVIRPDGQRFLSYLEVIEQEEEARMALLQQTERLDKQAERIEKLAAQVETQSAQVAKLAAQTEVFAAKAEKQSAQIEKQSGQLERLTAQLRDLGVEPDLGGPAK